MQLAFTCAKHDVRLACIKQAVRLLNLANYLYILTSEDKRGTLNHSCRQHVHTRLAIHYADGCACMKIVSGIVENVHN
jgi:hypothetical protein